MAKPTIILVPGAWHTPECFSLITTKLEEHGYIVRSLQLPAVGGGTEDLTPNIAALRDLVIEVLETGNDVVVAAHSWGGIVAGSALTGLGKKEREAEGKKGGIVRCVYMCAFMAAEGVSLMDAIQGVPPSWLEIKGPHAIVTNPSALYFDLSSSSQASWSSKIQPHSYATFTDRARAESWKSIPTTYLLCEDDQAIPAFAQEAMTEMVRGMGGDIEVMRVRAGHSPFLSVPDVVVGVIMGS